MARTILTNEQRKQLYELYQTGQYLNRDLAGRFGINSSSVHHIIREYRKKISSASTEKKEQFVSLKESTRWED